MENTWRWAAVTAIAPITWGSTYYVTSAYLPHDSPLWGATLRALPAGLLLLLLSRTLPAGRWWWRSAILGVLNVGAFFLLLYVAALLLPSSVASSIMAASPVVMMALAWALISQRPTARALLGAVAGILGVVLILASSTSGVSGAGVLASVSAMAMSSLGYVLATRWRSQDQAAGLGAAPTLVAMISWQATLGGLALLVMALAVEGGPPAIDAPAAVAFAYISVIATAVAFLAWYKGLTKLPAGVVGIVGLLNPVTGVLLGVAFASEQLSARQVLGIALVVIGILIAQVRMRPPRRRIPEPAAPAASSARTT